MLRCASFPLNTVVTRTGFSTGSSVTTPVSNRDQIPSALFGENAASKPVRCGKPCVRGLGFFFHRGDRLRIMEFMFIIAAVLTSDT